MCGPFRRANVVLFDVLFAVCVCMTERIINAVVFYDHTSLQPTNAAVGLYESCTLDTMMNK